MDTISTKDLQKKLEDGEKLSIVDVREDDEVAQGTIPGAQHIPLGELPSRMNELDKSEHLYLLCRSGGRSGRAGMFLDEHGFDTSNIKGGIISWKGPKTQN